MKTKVLFSFLLFPIAWVVFGDQTEWPEARLERATPQAHITYLASDALQGRDTGTPGAELAAAYIGEQYRRYGLEQLPSLSSYLQPVLLEQVAAPSSAEVTIDGSVFRQGGDLLLLDGAPVEENTQLVFAGYGWVDAGTGHDDYADLDVRGKIVLTIPGTPTESGIRAALGTLEEKRRWAAERGALGMLQLYQVQYPWSGLVRRYERSRLQLQETEGTAKIFSGWINNFPKELLQKLKEERTLPAQIRSSGFERKEVRSANVAGLLRGTDPGLAGEYVLLSAHYDHVGIGQPDQNQDSIYNGARDNALGVAALLAAAETLARKPPRRSVIFLAVTAEEKGLLGSRYYADHPLVPLEQTVFNLNTDGGGYNDTTAVAAIGYGRTGTDAAVEAAVALAGLEKVIPNPEPRQNFFDRSDNVSFARKGVPCLTVSPGFAEFDEEIRRYYHRPADEAASLDFDYVLRYCQVFAHTARLIADQTERPRWAAGDPYEAAGKALYGGE